MKPSNQIATFIDAKYGIAATVTETKRGYAVTFLDTDAEQIIETRIYPIDKRANAIAYARGLTNG